MTKMIAFANEIIAALNTEEERLEEVESKAREEADRFRARAEKDEIRYAMILIYDSLTREMQNELADMSKENERMRKIQSEYERLKKIEAAVPRTTPAQNPEPKPDTTKTIKRPKTWPEKETIDRNSYPYRNEADIRNATKEPEKE